ncbi:MAG: hypothetical protein ACLP7P_18170 [Rhodomicrobium sp.]
MPIDAVFIARALTQPWDADEAASAIHVPPQGRLRSIRALREHIAATRPRLLHIAGWIGAMESPMIQTAQDVIGQSSRLDKQHEPAGPGRFAGGMLYA